MCSKNDIRCNCGECLVAVFFIMTVSLPLCFSVDEYLAKRKSPLHSFTHQLSAVQLAFYFQSWRWHLMVWTVIHANCKMYFAKFQTVYIMQCLEHKHGHQACCIQSTGDCLMTVTTVVRIQMFLLEINLVWKFFDHTNAYKQQLILSLLPLYMHWWPEKQCFSNGLLHICKINSH